MDRHATPSQTPQPRTSLGGLALIVLLGLVAAIPAAMVDELSPLAVRRDAPGAARETATSRSISISLARAVRDLVGGSTVAAAAHCVAARAPFTVEPSGAIPAENAEGPRTAPVRPELLNIPPPAA